MFIQIEPRLKMNVYKISWKALRQLFAVYWHADVAAVHRPDSQRYLQPGLTLEENTTGTSRYETSDISCPCHWTINSSWLVRGSKMNLAYFSSSWSTSLSGENKKLASSCNMSVCWLRVTTRRVGTIFLSLMNIWRHYSRTIRNYKRDMHPVLTGELKTTDYCMNKLYCTSLCVVLLSASHLLVSKCDPHAGTINCKCQTLTAP